VDLADHTVTDGVERGPFAGTPPALYYSAAAAILAGRKPGMTSGTAGHEHIIVAATATIGVFGIRLRQLIGYDRLRSQPA
jgi:hypothetical protein